MSLLPALFRNQDPLTKLGRKIEIAPPTKLTPFQEFEMGFHNVDPLKDVPWVNGTVTGRIPSSTPFRESVAKPPGEPVKYYITNSGLVLHRTADHATRADLSKDCGKTWIPWQYKENGELQTLKRIENPLAPATDS